MSTETVEDIVREMLSIYGVRFTDENSRAAAVESWTRQLRRALPAPNPGQTHLSPDSQRALKRALVQASTIVHPGQTHYEGCWRDPKRHACAVAEVERLQAPGFVLVPVEPTEEMLDAVMKNHRPHPRRPDAFRGNYVRVYKAMLAAARVPRETSAAPDRPAGDHEAEHDGGP